MIKALIAHIDCAVGMETIENDTIDMILADPPYNISVKGAKWDTIKNYMEFSKNWLTQATRILRPGGALLIYGSPCETWIARLTIMLTDEMNMTMVQDLPWIYRQGGDTRWETINKYAVRHERLIWFEKPGGQRTFNAESISDTYSESDKKIAMSKGKGRVKEDSLEKGRPPKTFIDIPRENSRSKERTYGKHPSMKPLPLCERLILGHTNENDKIVVPFAGSGSEVLAAAKLDREVIGYETEVDYLKLIKKRFEGHDVAVSIVSPNEDL